MPGVIVLTTTCTLLFCLAQVSGVVRFEQADENSPVKVSGDITGNDANAKRGFHVHQVCSALSISYMPLQNCRWLGPSGGRAARFRLSGS